MQIVKGSLYVMIELLKWPICHKNNWHTLRYKFKMADCEWNLKPIKIQNSSLNGRWFSLHLGQSTVRIVRPRKKKVEFPLTRPTLFYGPYPTDFIGKFVYISYHNVPYRSRGPLIFPRIAVGNEGVCPRRRPRRYGTVYLYRALPWSSVVLWSCRHDGSPVSRPTWTYVVLLSCRHSRKAIKPDGGA